MAVAPELENLAAAAAMSLAHTAQAVSRLKRRDRRDAENAEKGERKRLNGFVFLGDLCVFASSASKAVSRPIRTPLFDR